MKNMKKFLAIALALVLTLSLAGAAVSVKAEEEVKELIYFAIGGAEDEAKVTEALNARLDELEAGYHIKFNLQGWGDYQNKLTLAAKTGEDWDLAFVASWMGPYEQLVAENALLDITELLPEHAPELYEQLKEEQIKGAMIDGKLYAVPTTITAIVARDHFVWNKKWVDELELDVSEMDTVESLEPALKAFKEANPDAYPLKAAAEWAKRRIKNWVAFDADGEAIVQNPYTSEEFVQGIETARKYYEAGYINPDAGIIDDIDQTDGDSWLVTRNEGEPGSTGLWTEQEGVEVIAYPTAEDIYVSNDKIQGKMTAVSSLSENAAEALDFIQKVATDEVIQNLLSWGIEGDHYNVEDGKAVRTENASKWEVWQNQFVSDAVRIPNPQQLAKDDPEFVEEAKVFNETLKAAPDLGFIIDRTDIDTELKNIEEIVGSFYKVASRGNYRDGDYEQFLEDLDTAGIENVIEAYTGQFEAWLAEQPAEEETEAEAEEAGEGEEEAPAEEEAEEAPTEEEKEEETAA